MTDTTRKQYPISLLPLPAKVLQNHLTKIDLGQAGHATSTAGPSEATPYVDQRRSRSFAKAGHWARVTPLPLEFPYRLPRATQGETQVGVEDWLKAFDTFEKMAEDVEQDNGLRAQTSAGRIAWKPELLGVSDTCVRDSLPQLDIGNAMEYTGAKHDEKNPVDELDQVGQELLDVISGRKVLRGDSYGPWSSRYAGHQFGSWAGQLGDGRAISILETVSETGGRQEIQLKGSGRTPFSRSADGLAVLRSGVREYLCAEAMAALGIPTSRSLALITHSEEQLQVDRENGPEPSSLLARVAPSFVRIGNFEILNPPEEAMHTQFLMLGMPGMGSGRSLERDYEGLRILGEWVAGEGGLDLKLKPGEPWAKKLVMESALRNARMVAGWQAYGFCHGVINTDNVSVLGLTIDYGPYAFMDIYDPYHICNHSDTSGRYDYRKQPAMVLFAIQQLLSSLAEVIGAEAESGKAIEAGWAENAEEVQLEDWRQVGISFAEEMEGEVMKTFRAEYQRLYSKRFGFATLRKTDLEDLFDPFFQIMATHELDFHSTMRALCFYDPQGQDESKLATVLDRLTETAKADQKSRAQEALTLWLKKYSERITSEQEEWDSRAGGTNWVQFRAAEMRDANPRFVLRQWLLEETIKELEQGQGLERRQDLSKIMQMACKPFEPYGGELLNSSEALTADQREEKRLCGLGNRAMLGFQCSCSS